MKHPYFLLSLLALTSCYQAIPSDEALDEPTPADCRHFTFTIKGDFRNTAFSSVPDASPSDGLPVNTQPTDAWGEVAQTRAADYMVADGVELTDLWVLDTQGGEIKQQLHQTSADQDWGAPEMNLTLGTHHILFLASRGQSPSYQDGIVTWQKPLDTFFCDYEVTVVKTSNGNRAVTLDRCVTKFSLVIEDAIADGTASITFAPETWYNGWNMLTSSPVAATDYVARYDLPQSWWGGTNSTLNMWGLSTTAEWQTDIEIESRTTTSVNAQAVILDAPFRANRVSVYRGNLYSNSSESSVSLNAQWLTDYEGVY